MRKGPQAAVLKILAVTPPTDATMLLMHIPEFLVQPTVRCNIKTLAKLSKQLF